LKKTPCCIRKSATYLGNSFDEKRSSFLMLYWDVIPKA